MYPIAVCLSGGGTTLQNLVDRIAAGSLRTSVVQVVSSKPNVVGVERALKANLPVECIERKEFAGIEEFSRATFDVIRQSGAKLVCLAGYLQLLQIPDDFAQRVINIHPSLLPAFGGKGMYGHHVHKAVLESGTKFTGCTVHFADNEYDQGPIVAQSVVAIDPDDTADTLALRVNRAEFDLYPTVIEAFAENRVRVEGRKVRITSR
jgi:phosphoribosylglycinamide formyltransferase 1